MYIEGENDRDTTKNGAKMQENIAKQRVREQDLVPLRVNVYTTIYVPREKATAEYAKAYNKGIWRSVVNNNG